VGRATRVVPYIISHSDSSPSRYPIRYYIDTGENQSKTRQRGLYTTCVDALGREALCRTHMQAEPPRVDLVDPGRDDGDVLVQLAMRVQLLINVIVSNEKKKRVCARPRLSRGPRGPARS
jgi:hypothetical protein